MAGDLDSERGSACPAQEADPQQTSGWKSERASSHPKRPGPLGTPRYLHPTPWPTPWNNDCDGPLWKLRKAMPRQTSCQTPRKPNSKPGRYWPEDAVDDVEAPKKSKKASGKNRSVLPDKPAVTKARRNKCNLGVGKLHDLSSCSFIEANPLVERGGYYLWQTAVSMRN
jgi:hypothetical protein